jgi:hypothetical protein
MTPTGMDLDEELGIYERTITPADPEDDEEDWGETA